MFRTIAALAVLASALCAHAKDNVLPAEPAHPEREVERWAEKTLKTMTLEQKVGQLFMVWARAEFVNIESPEYLKLREIMTRYQIGGFGLTVRFEDGFLHKNQPYEAAMLINQLQSESELPLLFAADFERGLSMRLDGVTTFPHAMAFSATGRTDFAREYGRITGEEARAIGVHWNFFPDADVNSNPANPIINTRSFGENPDQVAAMVRAYIEGAKQSGMLTTAKHFPGHGDTDIDSHLNTARAAGDGERLDSVELVPFRAAVDAGVDAVMIGHITAPALDPEPKHVATISAPIIEDKLRHEMGFRGLVVTDALNMRGFTRLFGPVSAKASGRAAVAVVKAGNDVLIIPDDLEGAYNGVVQAVRSGEIDEGRLDVSVRKILRAKASLGLHRTRLVNIEALKTIVSKPESLSLAQEIADASVTLVRDNRQVLPLRARTRGTSGAQNTYGKTGDIRGRQVAVIFTDDSRGDAGRIFDQQMRRHSPEMRTIWVDERNVQGMRDIVLQAVQQAQKVVVALYVIPSAGRTVRTGNGGRRASAGMGQDSGSLVQEILRRAKAKTAVVAMGNPYLVQSLPETQTYMCVYSNASVSEIAAVKALFGEIPIRGHLPVSIPGIAPRGTGIEVPAR